MKNLPPMYRLLIAILGIGTGIGILMYMRQLTESKELWGSLPLWFWISFWTGTLFLVSARKSWKNIQLILASSAAGVLLSLGFVPMPFFVTMFIGFIPLLWVERQLIANHSGTRTGQIFLYSFNTFLIWNFLSTYWVINTGFVAGMIANVLNAVLMTIPFMFYHIARQYHDPKVGAIALVSYWLAFEYGHMQWEISWPWLTLGNSFAHMPWAVQWYEYTGVFGGSLWILGLNVILAQRFFTVLDQLEDKSLGNIVQSFAKAWLWQPLLLLSLPIVVSVITYFTYNEGTGKEIEVVSVQPNYEPHYEKFNYAKYSEADQLNRCLDLASPLLSPATDYLLLPETMFWGIDLDRMEASKMIRLMQDFVKQYPNLNIIVGVSAAQLFNSTKGYVPPKAKETKYRIDGEYYDRIETYNVALQINNESDSIPVYKKSKLVVGAENIPYVSKLPMFKNLILDLGGASGMGLGTQAYRTAFNSKAGRVGPLICYESVYGGFVTNYISRFGAQVLFVVTNDGWWDNSPGHVQHMHFSRLRAIENRRSVVRSANTGISCFINSKGDIISQTKYDEPIALKEKIRLDDRITFYTKYKDLIARISILMAALLALSSFVKKWQISRGIETKGKKRD
ncbi:MAG: apolipoprotein N-acyltransferase [Saprospiraceae bacterium]|nr:apolipoprotein N-acyltransferase [Saprospiraceae bacterium]